MYDQNKPPNDTDYRFDGIKWDEVEERFRGTEYSDLFYSRAQSLLFLEQERHLLVEWENLTSSLVKSWLELGNYILPLQFLLYTPREVAERNAKEFVELAQKTVHKLEYDYLCCAPVYPTGWPIHRRWEADLLALDADPPSIPGLIVDANGESILLNLADRCGMRYTAAQRIVSGELLPDAQQRIYETVKVFLEPSVLPQFWTVSALGAVPQVVMPEQYTAEDAAIWQAAGSTASLAGKAPEKRRKKH